QRPAHGPGRQSRNNPPQTIVEQMAGAHAVRRPAGRRMAAAQTEGNVIMPNMSHPLDQSIAKVGRAARRIGWVHGAGWTLALLVAAVTFFALLDSYLR